MNVKLVYGLLSFVISFLLVGVLILAIEPFADSGDADTDTNTDTDTTEVVDEEEEETEDADTEETEEASASDGDVEALTRNNCVSCHSVSSLGIDGAVTGPDLSSAFSEVEGKHGKPLDEFMVEPTSAVMSTVIEGDPLSDEELEAVLNALEAADAAAN